jgi:SulP family sulfate permease
MFIPKSIVCLRNYNKSLFTQDLLAGLTVGVVALPLAMAFAIASGVTPERGIFTAVVAGFLISLLGGSRVQIGGPTGAFVVIVSAIVAAHGYDGLVICTIMAGILLIGMGFARFGGMIKFIPFPVVTGFTSGIAVVIFSTQIKDLLGLKIESVPPEFLDKWQVYFRHLGTINWPAAVLGIGTIIIIPLIRRIGARVPAMLIAMIIATLAVSLFHLPVETIGSRFGTLPHALPSPSLPVVTMARIRELASPALTVALLAAIESLLSATVADGMIGTRHKSNMELVAQGIANIASALLGGIPATGAIARTATNIKCGAKTPIAGMVHSITLLAILIFLAPLAKGIPLACLAGILVIVSWQMSEIEHFRQLLTAPRSDVLVLLATFLLTVLVDLTVAVQVGVVLAAMLFIRRMSEVTNVGMVTRELRDHEETIDANSVARRTIPESVEVFEINGPFFFGAAESFKDTLRLLERPPKVLILRMRYVNAVDATGLNVISELHRRSLRDGTTVVLSDVHAQPIVALQKSHLWKKLGEENITGNLDTAIGRACEILGVPDENAAARESFEPTVTREQQPAG